MGAVVLVHGAWQGSWCWDRVAPLVASAGHTVVTPTLTGSGDRAAELSPEVTLADHIADVGCAINDGDLTDIVLVGHSYAGMVLSGLAETHAERLKALVYVDAFYPDDGQSALDQMPPPYQALFRQRAADQGDGWRLPASEDLLDVWGLHSDDDRAWVGPQLTDWSLRCFAAPVAMPARRRSSIERLYVAGHPDRYPAGAAFAPIAALARDDGCRVVSADTGHDVMIEAPDQLAAWVLALA